MLETKRWLVLPLALILLGGVSCTDSAIDDGDAPDVQLEVITLENPAVTGTSSGVGCAFEIEDWAATMAAVPKNSLAITSPFNDITVIDVVVSYAFISQNGAPPPVTIEDRIIGLGDVTIPANGINSVSFAPISFDDILVNLPQIEGTTANMTLTFRAVTVEGAQIFDTVYRQLFIESCG